MQRERLRRKTPRQTQIAAKFGKRKFYSGSLGFRQKDAIQLVQILKISIIPANRTWQEEIFFFALFRISYFLNNTVLLIPIPYLKVSRGPILDSSSFKLYVAKPSDLIFSDKNRYGLEIYFDLLFWSFGKIVAKKCKIETSP